MSDFALLMRAVRAENRIFWRTPIGAFFTLGLPLIMLVLFVALFGNDPIGDTAYGNITTAQFYAPGLGVFAAASATYTNIAMTRHDMQSHIKKSKTGSIHQESPGFSEIHQDVARFTKIH